MKILSSTRWQRFVPRLVLATACFLPTLLQAHPGHYHPDETDEFDFFRATFLHSHGVLDYVLLAIAVSSLALVIFHGKPAVRIGALIAASGSLALLPIL